jgi:DNA invertase Pin-like site-specific DNA recombinase
MSQVRFVTHVSGLDNQQKIDTTTPRGKLLFQVTGAFAEFERTMIKTRVRAGMQTVRETLARDGKFVQQEDRHRPSQSWPPWCREGKA